MEAPGESFDSEKKVDSNFHFDTDSFSICDKTREQCGNGVD
jgi:hypothetical protein